MNTNNDYCFILLLLMVSLDYKVASSNVKELFIVDLR